MEDKQLNFNQPLLSVRRFSSTLTSQKVEKKKTDTNIPIIPPLPSYISELKSGPLRNAGSVPFVWEQSPGRPKSGKSPQIHAIDRPPTISKLPPGRTLKPKNQDSDTASKGTGVDNGPGENPFGSQHVVPSVEEKVTNVDSSKEKLDEHSSHSGDGDEAYMDALDTLSRGESSFYNCSVGGLSGLDSDVKPSETFSIDPKTRDLMMGRFLPAAKAMASEAPQHAPRKKPVVWEQPRQVKKVVNADKWPPLRFGPNHVQDYAHDNEEESDDDCDEHDNTSFKVCGLLPCFALKSSFCLLNPVPGMSARTRVPMSPVSRITQASSFSAVGSCNELEEPSRVAIYEQTSIHGFKAAERPDNKRVLKNEHSRIPRQSNSQKLEGSTLYKRLQGSGLSTHHNGLLEPLDYEKERFIGIPAEANGAGVIGFSPHRKGPNSFKELLANQTNSTEIESGSPIAEKTLYVDIVHKVESQKKNSRSADIKGLSDLREYDTEILATSSKALGETPYIHSLVKDLASVSIPYGEATLQSNVQNPVVLGMLADESTDDVVIEKMKDSGQGAKSYLDTKVTDNVNFDFNVLADKSKHSHGSFSELPPPPPLPKSPSDSWLWRTLPSVHSKSASLRSYLGTGVKPSSKTSSTDPKWEKIVRTAEAQHQHLRFSEGALTPIPET